MRWFKIFLFLSILVQTNNTLSAQNLAVKELDESIKEDTALSWQNDNPIFARHDSLLALEMLTYQLVEADTHVLITLNYSADSVPFIEESI